MRDEILDVCAVLKKRFPRIDRLLLVQLPQIRVDGFDRGIALRGGYFAFPPTGLQCLYEAVGSFVPEVRILDLNIQLLKRATADAEWSPEEWIEILRDCLDEWGPQMVGVSCMYDAGISPLMAVLRMLRERDDSIVVAGGVIPTYEREALLSAGLCDFVIKGEGEIRFHALLRLLTESPPAEEVPEGICFARDGVLRETPGLPESVSLDSDLVGSYALVPVETYHRYGSLNPFGRDRGRSYAAIQMNRGCRAACSFCSVPDFMGRGVRSRSVAAVLQEMEYLVTQRGVRHFEWLDDDLLYDRNAFSEILGHIITAGWKITWSANNGLIAASLTKDLLTLMRDSGCVGFRIGIESGNAEMLKRSRKPGSLDVFRRAASLVRDVPEIFVCGNYMLGFPGETFGQMMDTFRFAVELGLDWAGFTVCQPIRGAGMFEDFGSVFGGQMAVEGGEIANYIPARESREGYVNGGGKVVSGPDVFKVPPQSVPSKEQIKETWLTFTLTGNFILNPNLRQGGRPEKFAMWVERAQAAYPDNPYMHLFLGCALLLSGDAERATECGRIAAKALEDSYWAPRFEAFGLREVLVAYPRTGEEAERALEAMRRRAEQEWGFTPEAAECGREVQG